MYAMREYKPALIDVMRAVNGPMFSGFSAYDLGRKMVSCVESFGHEE